MSEFGRSDKRSVPRDLSQIFHFSLFFPGWTANREMSGVLVSNFGSLLGAHLPCLGVLAPRFSVVGCPDCFWLGVRDLPGWASEFGVVGRPSISLLGVQCFSSWTPNISKGWASD